MDKIEFKTVPFSIDLKECTVSSQILFNKIENIFEVLVIITRRPETKGITGEEIQLKLVTTEGLEMKLIDRPQGLLSETGGSLGVSINAVFRFDADHNEPLRIELTYKDQTAYFQLQSVNH